MEFEYRFDSCVMAREYQYVHIHQSGEYMQLLSDTCPDIQGELFYDIRFHNQDTVYLSGSPLQFIGYKDYEGQRVHKYLELSYNCSRIALFVCNNHVIVMNDLSWSGYNTFVYDGDSTLVQAWRRDTSVFAKGAGQ